MRFRDSSGSIRPDPLADKHTAIIFDCLRDRTVPLPFLLRREFKSYLLTFLTCMLLKTNTLEKSVSSVVQSARSDVGDVSQSDDMKINPYIVGLHC